MADLKAAGLSPVLAAGSGAESGPVVSTKPPQLEGLGDLSNALQFMQSLAMEATIDKTKAENLVLEQQAKKFKVNAILLISCHRSKLWIIKYNNSMVVFQSIRSRSLGS